ncbi:hypothetical protein RsTz2092_06020 [Deferribacterales bacterium RsTz2092]|nr:hypothetical protein AGMMS49941_03610 [Deferribacterales bacterium]
MNYLARQLHLLKSSSWGLALPKGSLLNYLKLKSGKITDTLGNGGVYPPMMSLLTVQRCNLNCSFCMGVKKRADWQEHELTPKKLERILELDIVSKVLVVIFEGGEPLLNKDLPELISMCRKRGHLVGIVSNGILLAERVDELVSAGLCDTQISVYEDTLGRLSKILPKVMSKHLGKLPINTSYVLPKSQLLSAQKGEFKNFLDLINMLKDSGCSSLKITLCESPTISALDLTETLMTTDAVYDEFIDVCRTNLKDICFEGYKSNSSFMPSSKFSLYFPRPFEINNSGRICRLPWQHIEFDADGNYLVCCHMDTELDERAKNVFEAGVDNINHEKAQKIRKALLDINIPLEPECVNCVQNSESSFFRNV